MRLENFEAADIKAMRIEGDLPAFMRLRIRRARTPVQVVALWHRFPASAGDTTGAWPSTAPPRPGHWRATGEADPL
ncbi:hypothetical protein [Streptomyces sp. NPDC006551]|uniref:hypothetical protein n=1 Tax=Streptomyces sp. NPDC006551 TaxID=3157178 RepID=UPI0033B5B458